MKKRERHDIVILRLDRIGDFVIWLSAAKRIRLFYLDRKITLICMPCNVEIAKSVGCFDCVIGLDGSMRSLVRKELSLKCNVLVQPTYSRTFFMEMVAKAIDAKEKIAIDGDASNCSEQVRKLFLKQYSQVINTSKTPVAELVRNDDFTNQLLGEKKNYIDLADLPYMKIKRIPGLESGYYVVNLGASDSCRRWSIERFVDVTKRIKNIYGKPCVLIGSKAENVLSIEFMNQTNDTVVNLVGKTNLLEMISLIMSADFVICNDTSTLHIAAAVNVKCFCIAPGYYYPRFTDYNLDALELRNRPFIVSSHEECWGCLNKKTMTKTCKTSLKNGTVLPCVDGVDVDSVFCAIKEYICAKEEITI